MRAKPLAIGALILAAPEFAFFLGGLAAGPVPSGGSCGVLALGFPTWRDGTPSSVQRHRVEMAVSAYRSQGCSVMVISGGSPHSSYNEAQTMGRLALEQGIPADRLILEKTSMDTWQNIGLSIPRLEGSDRIFLVSESLHAWRAKRYLCRQRPDLCRKAYPYSRYRPLQLYWMKWLSGLNELMLWLRDSLWGMPVR